MKAHNEGQSLDSSARRDRPKVEVRLRSGHIGERDQWQSILQIRHVFPPLLELRANKD